MKRTENQCALKKVPSIILRFEEDFCGVKAKIKP